jgi:hypothetical protein
MLFAQKQDKLKHEMVLKKYLIFMIKNKLDKLDLIKLNKYLNLLEKI